MLYAPAAVYLLCLITSIVCAFLLVRSYRTNRTRLLLFCAICFLLLALNNMLVVLDMILLPQFDLVPYRQLSTLAAVSVLLIGFIWETE
jgi:hypothetical protein